MNNFPAMTAEQRQELTEFLQGSRVFSYVEHIRLEKLRDQITLAALAAPPAPVLRVPDGWIKCSERYPEMGQEVLIRIPVCEKFNIENGKYEGDGRFLGAWFDTRGKGRPYKVTHWMPLPPPPEASNEQ